jgi:cellobiose phosphorylase
MSQYGYFDDDKREYVITDPKIPTKWINYIGTLEFGGFVDHTGGALLCAGDPALNRISKYMPQLPASSPKGTTLYLRIRGDNGYELVSPYFTPCLHPMEAYECRVGLGYQRFNTVVRGLRTEVTVFVPPGARFEIRDIRVTNERTVPVDLDLIPFVEYTHYDALKQYTNADWVPQTMVSDACWQEDGLLVLKQYAFHRWGGQTNFFTSNQPVDSFETDRSRFLGDHEYAEWSAPLGLQEESLSNTEARRGDNVGVLLHALGMLQPGETRRVITQLGQMEDSDILKSVSRFRDPANVEGAFEALAGFWERYLDVFQCETPDPTFNTTVNVHNPRQCYITMNWSRYLSLYQLGLGARGIGFRDSSQDVLGAMAGAPYEARALMEKLLSVQNPDGSAMHQFFPSTMEANEGDAREEGDKLVYGDDHLWIVLSVCGYLKETGDYAFLEKEIHFYDKTRPSEEWERGTVLEHLLRSVAYTKQHTGKHGLPLLGFADWNDTVNLPGESESLFNAHLYGRALLELIELLRHLGNEDRARALEADHRAMKDVVNQVGWDGEWYVRYFTAAGDPIGTHRNAAGKIFTNGQSWPVLAGYAEGDRARTALDSVYRHLNTEFGIKLSTPGYKRWDPEIGGITSYPPGAKENGGIFLHSNPWVMIAETLLGRGDRAFQYYQQINPSTKNDLIDRYEIEPYVYAQNILGDEHPQFGLGRNSWLSGTASWTYQAATQYILGIRPVHGGLLVDPCIPAEWSGFSVRRKFRGITYHIEVVNPEGVCKGVASLEMDGRSLPGNVLPVTGEGAEHHVRVMLGVTTQREVVNRRVDVAR